MMLFDRLLIAIDPGRVTGIAVFCGRLRSVSLARGKPPLLPMHLIDDIGDPCVVCEVPQQYTGSRVSAQSLLTLAFDAGYVVGQLRPSKIVLVQPREWKGQQPKDVCHSRLLGILRPEEIQILNNGIQYYRKSEQHNILDAVGLGLWYLGRRA